MHVCENARRGSGRHSAFGVRVTLPRAVYPGSASFITRRCTQRQFLLRPDSETNNAFIYCLAVAAKRTGIDVMNFVQMSNHLHDVIFDRDGNAPAFYEDFHKLLAKCVNAHRGRWENVFSTEQVCVVRAESREDLIDKLAYTATNPINDGLVARVDDWPGASGYRALLRGRPLKAKRPKQFFSERGTMPAEVTLELTIPSELGDRDEIVAALKARVESIEIAAARSGRPVLGRTAVLRQSWRDSPTSREPRRGLRPTIAAKNLWKRLEAIQRKREFAVEYRRARAALLAGIPIPFPHGTYWLRRFVAVTVESAATKN
jgi:REP element-mobilizing transposase RayT